MNYDGKEYLKIMQEAGYTRSLAVKVYEQEVAYWKRVSDGLRLHQEKDPRRSKSYDKMLRYSENKRVEAVFTALDLAEIEKEQGWLFVEDGEAFLNLLIAKYQGDLTQMNAIESAKLEMIDKLESKIKRQKKAQE